MKYRQVKVPDGVANRLKAAAAIAGMTMSKALEEAVSLFEDAHQSDEKPDPKTARRKK